MIIYVHDSIPLVSLLFTGLLIFQTVAESQNSGKSAKSREIHKNTQNTAKFGRNLIKYMFVQQFWNLSQLLKRANNVLKLPGVDYVAKNWVLAMMLKALPLVHFWSVLLLKEQIMTSVRKTLKRWSDQGKTDQFLAKFALKITTKATVFLPIFSSQVCPESSHEIPAKSVDFSAILCVKILRNLTFFSVTNQKPCL